MFCCIGHIWIGSLQCCGSSHGSHGFCCLSLDTSHQSLSSLRTNLVQRVVNIYWGLYIISIYSLSTFPFTVEEGEGKGIMWFSTRILRSKGFRILTPENLNTFKNCLILTLESPVYLTPRNWVLWNMLTLCVQEIWHNQHISESTSNIQELSSDTHLVSPYKASESDHWKDN